MAYEVHDFALPGASALAGGVSGGGGNDLAQQVDAWIADPPPALLTIVYIGHDDIRTQLMQTASLDDYGDELDRLIAAGATASGRAICLALVHDFSSVPGAEAGWDIRTGAFNSGVQALADARPGVFVVDLFTPFQDILANPAEYGLVDVAENAGGDRPGWLFASDFHFGSYGHRLLGWIFDYCLRHRWDLTAAGDSPSTLNGEVIDYLRARSPPAWQVIAELAAHDGWACCFDPTNPNTRTLRNSGGTDYVTAIADALGNWPDLVQATEAKQPPLSPGYFGRLDGLAMNGSSHSLQTSAPIAAVAQPTTHMQVRRLATLDHYRFNISMTSHGAGNEQHCYVESFVWGGYSGAFAGGGLVGGARQLTPEVMATVFNGGSTVIYRDGTSTASGNAGTRQINGLTLGSNIGQASEFWPGELGPTLVRLDGDAGARTRMNAALQAFRV